MSEEEELKQIRLLLANKLARDAARGKIEVVGTGKISTATDVITLNASYYHNIVIRISNPEIGDTNVFLNTTTLQTQMPTLFVMNAATSRIRIKGIQATSIFVDSSFPKGAEILVYFIGYDAIQKPDIDASSG